MWGAVLPLGAGCHQGFRQKLEEIKNEAYTLNQLLHRGMQGYSVVSGVLYKQGCSVVGRVVMSDGVVLCYVVSGV